MAVVLLAMIAVVVGFVFIAIIGKEPMPVLREGSDLDAEGAAGLVHFDDIESFERAVVELIEAQGMTVSDVRAVEADEFEVFAKSGDGLGAGTVVFHCLFTDEPVGADRVSSLLSAVRGERAMKGVYVTSDYFTADVHSIAEGPAVDLVNIERLSQLLTEYGIAPRAAEAARDE